MAGDSYERELPVWQVEATQSIVNEIVEGMRKKSELLPTLHLSQLIYQDKCSHH